MEQNNVDTIEYKPKDFASDQDVRWCPGCGDYSILAQVQKAFPDIGVKKENIVWISGIGCSSRFPYYMSTYGFHTIHGRAPAIATGLKIARPDLSVWVATGDGDLLSIGGNHFIHACRKNVDINMILFNNEIYGLTKGQYSPTSAEGSITKTSPYGSIDHPFNPSSMALGAEATFVARGLDRDAKHMQYLIKRAGAHKGISFIEVYQNCVIFNDGVFDDITSKENRKDHTIMLEHGQPMIFGEHEDKGIVVIRAEPKVVDLNKGNFKESDLWVHDEHDTNPMRAFFLAHMTDHPDMPTPFGIFRDVEKSTYDGSIQAQVDKVTEKKGKGDLDRLLYSGNTWEVK